MNDKWWSRHHFGILIGGALAVVGAILFALLPETALGSPPVERSEWMRVLRLEDYNTRVVVLGTGLFGMAAGVVGTFLLLRKRALLSDVIGHAALPGIPIAFLWMVAAGGDGKNFAGLITGAAISGTLGMLTVLAIRNFTRLKDDAALGIVLSVYFAFGISLVVIASRSPMGSAAGLETFIYGKTAAMLFTDAMLMGAVALTAIVACIFLYKEFKLLCFDQNFMATQGWPVFLLDVLLMTLIVIVTVSGLQAVGLILVVALLVIPPAAAQFWTYRLSKRLIISGCIGAVSGMAGAIISALARDLPAGAIIVLVAAVIFSVSLVFGTARGIVPRMLERLELNRKTSRQHVLRALFELAEEEGYATQPALCSQPFDKILAERSWSPHLLRHTLRRVKRQGLVRETSPGHYALTAEGTIRSLRVVRSHRLWELYLINYADTAPSVVDRGADQIEHILDDEMIGRLERLAEEHATGVYLPPSPHGPRPHGGGAP